MAEGELDPNTIAAEFLSNQLDSLVEGMKGVYKEAADKIRLRLDKTYRSYLTALAARYSKAKSFMLRGESVPLYNFYVPLDILAKRRRIQEAGIRHVLSTCPRAIIIGSGGSGKSMFIRHLLMDALATKLRIPVFIELRQFNSSGSSLRQVIEETLTACGLDLGSSYIEKALELGHFLVFLDGYDEVAHDKRARVAREIRECARTFDRNALVITSRPDPALEGWQDFALHAIAPLTVDQAGAIIARLPYDEPIKARFIRDLGDGLFQQHKSFLSNPLLLSIMLLSYGQSAGIPSKLSVFYNQAYEALFERHDVLKDGYRRELRSGLDIQDFAKLFAAFCLRTYDKSQVAFVKSEVLAHIDKAQDLAGVRVDRNCYLQDLTEAVCLLVEDGLQIVYPHRSFQEYFAARFICDAPPTAQEKLIDRYTRRGHSMRTDTLLTMLHEMRPDVVERYYLIPGLTGLIERLGIKGAVREIHVRKYQKLLVRRLLVGEDSVSFGLNNAEIFELALFALQRCAGGLAFEHTRQAKESEQALVTRCRDAAMGNEDPYEEVDPWKDEAGRKFMADLGESKGSIFSGNALRTLVTTARELAKKAKSGEESLERILRS